MDFRRREMTITGSEYNAVVIGTVPGGGSVSKEQTKYV